RRRAPAWRRARAARARRRLLRLGGLCRWAAAPRRRRLGRRAVPGDAAAPRRRRERRPRAAPLLVAVARRGDLPRRAGAPGSGRALHADAPAATRLDGLRPPDRRGA